MERVGKELKTISGNEEGETGDSSSCAPVESKSSESKSSGLSANQVAAKAMRLRLMGKHKEADQLLGELDAGAKDTSIQRPHVRDLSTASEHPRQVKGGELARNPVRTLGVRTQSCDAELAQSISRNKLYKGNEDDEYDGFGGTLETERSHERKGSKKQHADKGLTQSSKDFGQMMASRLEQCQFCFENTQRPKHLVIALANFTYLMMPTFTPLTPLHCCIVPMQHDGSTRNVDDNVWQEMRNFKKCLVQMFGGQGKGVLFLETAMGLTQQRRHCYIECIPVPSDILEDAPLYFKQAIDEAEDEWSQHNAKKLIDTRKKDLRNCIPKGFPYFHVEFGMQGGYCHVIDDEKSFSPQFGVGVVAGMLELIPENASGHRRKDSVEKQKTTVKDFLKLWGPFDWTKMLD